ncbi:MAG: ABC transporter permease [Candidatus Korarchaeum sp.]
MSVEEYTLRGILRELLRYKSALVGFAIIAFLVALSIYAILFTPYSKAGDMWNDQNFWLAYPRNAAPEWYNLFSQRKLPPSMLLGEGLSGHEKKEEIEGEFKIINYRDKFTYNYDDFPTELILIVNSTYSEAPPRVEVSWVKPSGEELDLGTYTPRNISYSIYITNNILLEEKLKDHVIERLGYEPEYSVTIPVALFMDYGKELSAMKGDYELKLRVTLANRSDTFSYRLLMHGKVYGIAGTDVYRRPLELGIIWGAPIALSFGIIASVTITFVQLIFAAISGYYGGKIDSLIQRLTEIYMILPFLPFLVMISLLYGLDIWRLLLVVIFLSIFGTSVKTYRVWVMQLKTSPYVEAALAYGASNLRIISLYILPRILPPVVPSLVLSIPSYVFLEAALALLGLSDPKVVSWGRIIEEAFANGAVYKGYYHWVLIPSTMLILTAISFALIGLALDRIVNPRLREI